MDKQKCLELYAQGKTKAEIRDIMGVNYETVRSCIQRTPNHNSLRGGTVMPVEESETPADISAAIRSALKKPNGLDKESFCHQFNLTPRLLEAHIDDLRDGGLLIDGLDGKYRLQTVIMPPESPIEMPWSGDRIIRGGLVGDTQLGSKDQQLTALERQYDIFVSEGIETVYHTGDMSDGYMRQGHEYELHVVGADATEDYIIKKYPRRNGIKTFFIGGNHDGSYIRRGGHDIGRVIGEHLNDKLEWEPGRRDDMRYLGMSDARIMLTPNCTLELLHPEDGSAYALSYSPQKIMDSMQGGEKPSIVACGHYHKFEYLFYRNIHFVQTACFQRQTRWMKAHKLGAYVGGCIFEAHVSDDGAVQRFKIEYFPVYRMIDNDF